MYCDPDIDRGQEWLHLKGKLKGGTTEWYNLNYVKHERLFGQIRSIESNIGLELSLVPQVECVVVDKQQEDGKGLRVLTVINDRDPEIRAKIYKREQAIIDAYPMVTFDFHIISRLGRSLEDMIKGTGEIAYQRR